MAYRLTGSKDHPVDLLDLEDDNMIDLTDDHPVKPHHAPSILLRDSLDEDEHEAEAFASEPHKNDSDDALEITEEEYQDNLALAAQFALAALPIGHRRIQSTIVSGDQKLEAGKDVEFYDGDFMRIKDILQHGLFGQVFVRGTLLRRHKKLGMFLEYQLNEVCAVLQVPPGSSEPMAGTSLVSRPVTEVQRIRKVVFTNLPMESLSFRTEPDYTRYCDPFRRVTEPQLARSEAILTCRRKFVMYWNAVKKSPEQRDIKLLRQSEADPGKGMSDAVRRRAFCYKEQDKMTVQAESVKPNTGLKRQIDAIDLTDEEVTTKFRKTVITDMLKKSKAGSTFHRRRESVSYETSTTVATSTSTPPRRYGDICAGGGGMTRGADFMGWPVELLLDKDPNACKTLQMNYNRRAVCNMDIFDYTSELRSGLRPANFDVLHVSLPCQYFSPAHTREGKDDAANSALLFATDEILKQCRPRIVTFEQTSGLRTHHPDYFALFIQSIVREGYSLSEKIVNCADVGNGQARHRLMIIASCPGQRTPPFPKATHGTGPGLKPLTTIADCLNKVRYPLEAHMKQFTDKRDKGLPPYNPNRPLRNAITCDGGESDLHPNGKRSFNMAELAALAGFDPDHRFPPLPKKELRKLIGNACPGSLARAIFSQVGKTLDETDAEEEKEMSTAIFID